MSEREIRVDWGVGIVGDVAKTGESCIVNDCYKDSRFNVKIDEQTGYTTKTMMCSPIKDKTGEVLGVSQVINKNGEGYFNEKDEVVFERYLQFCGIGLRNAQLFTMEQLAVQRVQELPESFQASNRFPKNIGITGQVATGGDTVNITNAYEDNRFDQDVDRESSFKHSTVLATRSSTPAVLDGFSGSFSLSTSLTTFPSQAMTSILWTLLPYSAEWVSPM